MSALTRADTLFVRQTQPRGHGANGRRVTNGAHAADGGHVTNGEHATDGGQNAKRCL
ncbi:MAG: hypothetical protein ACYDEO_15285 [Aggregatilineales bacterium]